MQANSSTHSEDGIVITQIALELIYNWLVIEKRNLLLGRDSENISASNKIRLILAQINVRASVPNAFEDLKQYVTSNKDIVDAPEAFVQIRNMIVHSQESKRKKLTDISSMTKYEALQLGIWYVELSIMFILKFNLENNS
jgi:hypothetical protein